MRFNANQGRGNRRIQCSCYGSGYEQLCNGLSCQSALGHCRAQGTFDFSNLVRSVEHEYGTEFPVSVGIRVAKSSPSLLEDFW